MTFAIAVSQIHCMCINHIRPPWTLSLKWSQILVFVFVFVMLSGSRKLLYLVFRANTCYCFCFRHAGWIPGTTWSLGLILVIVTVWVTDYTHLDPSYARQNCLWIQLSNPFSSQMSLCNVINSCKLPIRQPSHNVYNTEYISFKWHFLW